VNRQNFPKILGVPTYKRMATVRYYWRRRAGAVHSGAGAIESQRNGERDPALVFDVGAVLKRGDVHSKTSREIESNACRTVPKVPGIPPASAQGKASHKVLSTAIEMETLQAPTNLCCR
jgi:hypothetical protein